MFAEKVYFNSAYRSLMWKQRCQVVGEEWGENKKKNLSREMSEKKRAAVFRAVIV